eukprot:914997-Pyramimonas_sp.AAC.3
MSSVEWPARCIRYTAAFAGWSAVTPPPASSSAPPLGKDNPVLVLEFPVPVPGFPVLVLGFPARDGPRPACPLWSAPFTPDGVSKSEPTDRAIEKSRSTCPPTATRGGAFSRNDY